jgi:ABC-type molybdate transport system substrate-binding protein
MKHSRIVAAAVAFAMMLAANIAANAAEIRVISSNALKSVMEQLAPGEAEIGMTQISEILPYAGAELVGPLPKEIQLTTSFAAAIGARARQSEAAQALIKFLTAPAAAPVFKAKGLDPAS